MTAADPRATSLGKFNYALRPAKNIERKMLCEAFGCLACIAPLRRYRYIGFGSIEFVDFALFHQRLGMRNMVSIECREEAAKRVAFNRPYSCIDVKFGRSSDVLPILDWNHKTIIWLDYDRPLTDEILGDIRLVASSLVSGSIFVVTVDAKPREPEGSVDVPGERLRILTQNVGSERLPLIEEEDGTLRPTRGRDLANWGLARASRLIINNEIARTLKDRNGPLNKRWRLSYDQLFNFHYADGAKMLTVGGIILHPEHKDRMPASTFALLEFVRRGNEPYLIEPPVLTSRELRHLDNVLTKRGFSKPVQDWLPAEECDKYRKVYRYYPTFAEVEA